jgi:biotin carboxyl carrier protein
VENTLQGLNLTVAGMGLVFFALAIVMVAMIGLDRLFPGKAQAAGSPVGLPPGSPAPPAPGAAVAFAPAAGSPRFQASVGGQSFTVEAKEPAGKTRQFAVGERVFKVERSKASIGEILIDGEPYRAEVLGVSGGLAKIKLGSQTLEVRLTEAAAPAVSAPAPSAPVAATTGVAAATAGAAVGRAVPAPLPGKILRVLVAIGDRVKDQQELCVLEAMKMENVIKAQGGGVVRHIVVQSGQNVAPGETLMWIE